MSSPAAVTPASLSQRLRELREHRWPDTIVRQRTVAEGLGVSVPLVSSWENDVRLTPVPEPRLRDYARFFATRGSVENGHGQLIPDSKLTAAEQVARDDLYDELLALRRAATHRATTAQLLRFNWKYPKGASISIVCGSLDRDEGFHRYMDPGNPNFTEMLTFADADALIELFGHLRSVNPDANIRYYRTDQLELMQSADIFSNNVILLGGGGLNAYTTTAMTGVPIRQVADKRVTRWGEIFEVTEKGHEGRRHVPVLHGRANGPQTLEADVGLLARVPNPNNVSTTLTICSGVFARGVVGAVRTLTDDNLRLANESYLSARFAGAASFAVLMRVRVMHAASQTPDLRIRSTRLYEWSQPAA